MNTYRGKLDPKLFYELSSVAQAVRQWKDLIYPSIGPVTEANLHSNPDDPPDVTLVAGESGGSLSVEHTDFNTDLRGYINHLHTSEFPSKAIFLPPVSDKHPRSREDTLRKMFNPAQTWTTPIEGTTAIAYELEECVKKKLGKFAPDLLVVTDKLALDSDFEVAVLFVIARIREGNLTVPENTRLVFYSELDPKPTRFTSFWVEESGTLIKYRNSRGLTLESEQEIVGASGLDRRRRWYS